MTDDRSDSPNKPNPRRSRLVAGFSAGWRALMAAYTRITLPTPPFSGAAQSGDVGKPNAKKPKHS